MKWRKISKGELFSLLKNVGGKELDLALKKLYLLKGILIVSGARPIINWSGPNEKWYIYIYCVKSFKVTKDIAFEV